MTTTTVAAPTTTVAPVTTTQPVRPPSLEQALFDWGRLLGYLWADGNYVGDHEFWFMATTVPMAEEFERVAARFASELVVLPRADRPWQTKFKIVIEPSLRAVVPESHGWIDDVPPGVYDHVAFATSVIEGEGGRNGLVYDDPDAGKRGGFARLLDTVGVRTVLSGHNVFATRDSWPVFDSWPFVSCGRVPGTRSC